MRVRGLLSCATARRWRHDLRRLRPGEPRLSRASASAEGKPVEPKAFASRYWYRCLWALGFRVRVIYWKWFCDGDDTKLRRFAALDASLFGDSFKQIAPRGKSRGGQIAQRGGRSSEKSCEEGDLNQALRAPFRKILRLAVAPRGRKRRPLFPRGTTMSRTEPDLPPYGRTGARRGGDVGRCGVWGVQSMRCRDKSFAPVPPLGTLSGQEHRSAPRGDPSQ